MSVYANPRDRLAHLRWLDRLECPQLPLELHGTVNEFLAPRERAPGREITDDTWFHRDIPRSGVFPHRAEQAIKRDGTFRAVAFTQGTSEVTAVSRYGRVTSWDTRSGRITRTRVQFSRLDPCTPACISADGATVVVRTRKQEVAICDRGARSPVTTIAARGLVAQLALSPDAQRLAICTDSQIRVFARAHQGPAGTTPANPWVLRNTLACTFGAFIALPAAGNQLLSGAGASVRIWDLTTGASRTARLDDPPSSEPMRGARDELINPSTQTTSPSGEFIAIPTPSGAPVTAPAVRIWCLQTGDFKYSFGRSRPCPYHVSFSPDSRCVAVSVEDGSLYAWELESGHQVHASTHSSPLASCTWSPDGQFIAAVEGGVNGAGRLRIVRLGHP